MLCTKGPGLLFMCCLVHCYNPLSLTYTSFSLNGIFQESHHWTGKSTSSLFSSLRRFCHSCVRREPSSDMSFFFGFPSESPSGERGPPCVWKRTERSPCLCPPTRYCPSCLRSAGDPTGTGTGGSSFCCLLVTIHSTILMLCFSYSLSRISYNHRVLSGFVPIFLNHKWRDLG